MKKEPVSQFLFHLERTCKAASFIGFNAAVGGGMRGNYVSDTGTK